LLSVGVRLASIEVRRDCTRRFREHASMLRRSWASTGMRRAREIWTHRVVIGAAAVLAAGCGAARRDAPVFEPPPPVEVGMSSWYGAAFAGRPTASGERFDPARLTAAHRTLPMGSIVRVTNLDNGRSVVVRINDRGPFIHGRVLDCSEAAARTLGFRRRGIARVAIEWPPAATAGSARGEYWLQLGAFRDATAARRLRHRLEAHAAAVSLHQEPDYVRVHAGPYPRRDRAEAARDELRRAGFLGVVVVLDDAEATRVD
jgi:rare lipoprotein A